MTSESFLRLYEITKKLRGENGCPWEKVQTPLTLRETFIEETFEAVDAITEGDGIHAKEELGDVFFNVLLISFCYEQAGTFTVAQMLDEICEKLVRRHPHVFGGERSENVEEISGQWERIKEEVEGRKSESVLDSVPKNFPPLLKSFKLLKKAAKAGFDWRSAEQAKNKVYEELEEISGAIDEKDASHIEEEAGDMLLAAVNYCRKLGVNPDVALNRANGKFSSRFRHVENEMKKNHLKMEESNDEKMLSFWKQAKCKSG